MICITKVRNISNLEGGFKKLRKITDLCSSTYSMSPENEKNSSMSCSAAPKETLTTLTVFIWEKNTSIKTLKPEITEYPLLHMQ